MKNEYFKKAFNAWAASNQDLKSADSHAVYEDMWNVFADHVNAEKPNQVRGADIKSLLIGRPGEAPRELNQRYQARLVALIDKVLQHDAEINGHQPPAAVHEFLQHNMGIKQSMQRNRKENEPELVYLSAVECSRLISVLQRWPNVVGQQHATLRWQDCRDATSTALQLAAGLSPTDIRALEFRSGLAACKSRVAGDPMIWVPGNGKLDERKTPIAAWAMLLLQRWIELFESNNLATEWLFPGRGHAVPAWSKPSQYEAAKTIMNAAGLGHMTSFHLRHTWALKHLAAGQSEQHVARWLGVREDEVMHRYRDALPKFQQNAPVVLAAQPGPATQSIIEPANR